MRIKRPRNIEFQAFKDGMCNIYNIDEEGNKNYKFKNLNFDNRILGFKRVYAAQAVNSNINRVIRIPFVSGIDNYDCLEIIREDCYYTIDVIQSIYDSNPASIDLTLKKVGVQ